MTFSESCDPPRVQGALSNRFLMIDHDLLDGTYPECDEDDLRATLKAIAELEPVTIFHEPINIRAENVARIEAEAAELGISLKTEVFNTPELWQDYAINSLRTVERLAAEIGVADRLHLWPDRLLGNLNTLKRQPNAEQYCSWLHRWWSRVSEWPTQSLVTPGTSS